jgi:hypothetical protein
MAARIRPKGRPAKPHNRVSRQTIKLEPDVRNFLIRYGQETQRPMTFLINNIVRAYAHTSTVPANQLRLEPLDTIGVK